MGDQPRVARVSLGVAIAGAVAVALTACTGSGQSTVHPRGTPPSVTQAASPTGESVRP